MMAVGKKCNAEVKHLTDVESRLSANLDHNWLIVADSHAVATLSIWAIDRILESQSCVGRAHLVWHIITILSAQSGTEIISFNSLK